MSFRDLKVRLVFIWKVAPTQHQHTCNLKIIEINWRDERKLVWVAVNKTSGLGFITPILQLF